MPDRMLHILIGCLFFIASTTTLYAQNKFTISLEKPTCLLGEHNTVTYTIEASQINDTIFPSNYHFEKVTIIESGLVKKEGNTFSKKFIFSYFDSGTVKLPNFQTKPEPAIAPSCNFNFLPKDKIPDSILPKLPPELIATSTGENSFFTKYKWILLATLVFIIALYFVVKTMLKRKTSATAIVNKKTTSQDIKNLKIGESQVDSAKLYTILRNTIIEILHEKNYIKHNSPTITELKYVIEKYEKDVTDINLLEQVLSIGEPTLYAKYYPNVDTQEKHIASVAHFIQLETGR